MRCEFCSNEFNPRKSDQRFCSPKCQNKCWQKNNIERQREIWRIRYWRNREAKLEYAREYRKTHPIDKDYEREYRKRYNSTERVKIANRAKVKRYRARKLGATGSHTREEFLELVLRFDNFCPACGERFATSDFTEDHIVPLSCGGSNNISNIQPLCHPCNSGKRNKTKNYRTEEYGYHSL